MPTITYTITIVITFTITITYTFISTYTFTITLPLPLPEYFQVSTVSDMFPYSVLPCLVSLCVMIICFFQA